METEAAPEVTVPAGRTRKPKVGRVSRKPRVLKGLIEAEPNHAPAVNTETGEVYGWPIRDGFARIMVFADPSEGNRTCFFETKLGDHPVTWLAKNRMHVLPMGLVNNICDTANEYPVDDLSDPQNPKRTFEVRPRLPHSEPIPATAAEYVEYRKAQEKLIHPNKFKKL